MIPKPQNKISIQAKQVREKSGTNRKRWSRRMSSKNKCENPFQISTVIQKEDFPVEKENQQSRLLYSSRAQQTMSNRMKEIRSKLASRSNERFTQLKQQLKISDNKSEQPQGPTELVNQKSDSKQYKKTCEKLKNHQLKESNSQQIEAYYRTQPQMATKSAVSGLEDQINDDQQLFYFGDISPTKKLIKALIDYHGSNDGDNLSVHNKATNLGKDLRAGSIGSISHGPDVISPLLRPQFVQNTTYRNSQSQTAILQNLPSNVSSSQVNKVTRIINQILQDPEQSSIAKSLGLNLEKVAGLNHNKQRQAQTNRYAEQNLEDQHSILNQSRFQQSPDPGSRLKLNNSITAEVLYGDTCAIVHQSPNITLDNSRIAHITAFDLQKESGKTVLMYPQCSLNLNKIEEERDLSSIKQEEKRSMNIDVIRRINSRFDTQITKRDDKSQGTGSVMKKSTRYNAENFNRELEEDSILSSRCHYAEQNQKQSENCSAKERLSHNDQAVVLTQNSSEITTGSEGQVESSYDSDQNRQISQDIAIKQSTEKRIPGNDVNVKNGVMYGYNNLDLQETQMIDFQTKKYNKLQKKYHQLKKLYNELLIQHEQVQSNFQNSEAEREDLWLKLQKFECRLKQAQLVLNDQNDEVDLQFNKRVSAAVLTQVSDQQDASYTPLIQQQKDDLILINQNTSFSNSINDVLQKKKQIRFIEHEIKSARKSFNQQVPLIAPFQVQSLQSKVKESITKKLFGSQTMRSLPQSFSLANLDEKKNSNINLKLNISNKTSQEDLMTPVPISQQRIVKQPPSVKKSVPKIDLSSLVAKDQLVFLNAKDVQDSQNCANNSLVSGPTATSKSFSKLNLNKTSMTLGQLLRPSSSNLIIGSQIQQTQNLKNIPSQTPKNTTIQSSIDLFSQDRNINPLESSSHDISANSGCKQFKMNIRNTDHSNLLSTHNFGLGEQEDIFSLEFLQKNNPSTLLQKTQKIQVQKSDFSQLASQVDMFGKNQAQQMHSFYQTTGNLKQVFRNANILDELKSQNKPSLEVVCEETKKRTRNTCKNQKLTIHKSPVKTDLESLLKPQQRIMSQIKNAVSKTQNLFPKQITPSKKLINNPMGVIIAQQSIKKQAN